MAQHFLLSRSAKTLSLASVFTMKLEEAEARLSSWREDNRRVSNGDHVNRITRLALKRGKSVDFTGYWQRHMQSA
jgi:hypothetical protein